MLDAMAPITATAPISTLEIVVSYVPTSAAPGNHTATCVSPDGGVPGTAVATGYAVAYNLSRWNARRNTSWTAASGSAEPCDRRYPSCVRSRSVGASRSEISTTIPRLRTVAATCSSGAVAASGRPFVHYEVPFGEVLPLGDPPFNPEMAEHFWQSFATAAGITLHVRLREGRNMSGVPILNKIPYISRLFKNTGVGRETESLMMMVTPRIIIQEEEEEKLGIELEE